MNRNEIIEKMRKDGYPYKIVGNGGYEATLLKAENGAVRVFLPEEW